MQRIYEKEFNNSKKVYEKLFFYLLKLLNVYGTFSLQSVDYRWLVELLSCSQFLNNTCLFKFSLELLQRFFNVFAFFYWYYNHFVFN